MGQILQRHRTADRTGSLHFLDDLPLVVLIKVLTYLSTREKLQLSRVSKTVQHLVKQSSEWRNINLTWLEENPKRLTKGFQILKTYAGNGTKSVCLGSVTSNNILQFLSEKCPDLESITLCVKRTKHLQVGVDLSLLSRNLREINLSSKYRYCYYDREFLQEPFLELRRLSLEHAFISDILVSQISLSKHLNSLVLHECLFTGLEEVDILTKHLPKLESICLDGCKFSHNGRTEAALFEAALLSIAVNVRKLSDFSITNPSSRVDVYLVTDNFLEALESNKLLQSLCLVKTIGFTSSVFSNFLLHHPLIERLHLTDCYEVTDDFLKPILDNLTQLKDLSLSGCYKITCDGLTTVSYHPTLRKLDLSKVEKSEVTVLSIVETLPSIEHLILSTDYRDSQDNIKQVKPYLVISFRPWPPVRMCPPMI